MKIRPVILPILFFIMFIALWELIPILFNIPSYIFPRASETWLSMIKIPDLIINNLKITFLEAFLGFLIGSGVGFFMGILLGYNVVLRKTLLPYLIASNAIPIVAIAPIVLIWFKYSISAQIFLSAFLCFFPLTINTYRGLNEFNHEYRELFATAGATKLDFFLKFQLQNALPYIFAGLKLNATYAVIGAVVSEFVGADSGLGYAIVQASNKVNMPRMFGYLIISCLLGLIMYNVVYLIEIGLKKYRIR